MKKRAKAEEIKGEGERAGGIVREEEGCWARAFVFFWPRAAAAVSRGKYRVTHVRIHPGRARTPRKMGSAYAMIQLSAVVRGEGRSASRHAAADKSLVYGRRMCSPD